MPVYDYKCADCKKRFTLTLTIAQKSATKVKCPKCAGRNVEQQYSAVYAVTSKKS